MNKHKRLLDAYQFEGFVPLNRISGIFGDPLARIIPLHRRGKKRFVEGAARLQRPFTIGKCGWSVTSLVGIIGFIWRWKYGGFPVRVVAR
jgi:hypothetical protein